MNHKKEQPLDRLRIERFARLSAPAVGLNWNTYKRIHSIACYAALRVMHNRSAEIKSKGEKYVLWKLWKGD